MAEKLKKGDHAELLYVGREKLSGQIFDLNNEEAAKKEGIHNPKHKYETLIVCIGQKDVVEGLDEALVNKEVGQEFKVEIQPEKAFGKSNNKLYQLVSMAKFKERPFPGMQVNVNDRVGMVKTVSGGRVMIDFNHPLAGKIVEYEVKINRKVTDDVEKVESFLKMYLNIEPKVEIKEGNAVIAIDMPETFQTEIINKLKERVPSLKKVEFKMEKPQKEAKTTPKKE